MPDRPQCGIRIYHGDPACATSGQPLCPQCNVMLLTLYVSLLWCIIQG